MSAKIDYYFSMVSPWAFIGHDVFMELVKTFELEVSYRPVFLPKVFEETGGLPLAKRHPARQRYRLIELQRWREKRGLKFDINPKFWPFDTKLADQVAITLIEQGINPSPFMAHGFRAIWLDGKDLADETVLTEVLESTGAKGAAMVASAKKEEIAALYDRNTQMAIDGGYFGSPCYVLNGEPFWGQDRLELLEDALRSGRDPYLP